MLVGCMMIGLLLLLPGAATAQAANGTLELKVTNAAGEPVDGAEVRVNDESIDKTEFNNDLIEGKAAAETDSDGRFRNASVPVGVKNITVGNPGDSEFKYESQYHESVAILIDETTTEQFTLKEKQERLLVKCLAMAGILRQSLMPQLRLRTLPSSSGI